MEYFQAHNPTAERMTAGANEAEWIVTLTTRADHQNKCVPPIHHPQSSAASDHDGAIATIAPRPCNPQPDPVNGMQAV